MKKLLNTLSELKFNLDKLSSSTNNVEVLTNQIKVAIHLIDARDSSFEEGIVNEMIQSLIETLFEDIAKCGGDAELESIRATLDILKELSPESYTEALEKVFYQPILKNLSRGGLKVGLLPLLRLPFSKTETDKLIARLVNLGESAEEIRSVLNDLVNRLEKDPSSKTKLQDKIKNLQIPENPVASVPVKP